MIGIVLIIIGVVVLAVYLYKRNYCRKLHDFRFFEHRYSDEPSSSVLESSLIDLDKPSQSFKGVDNTFSMFRRDKDNQNSEIEKENKKKQENDEKENNYNNNNNNNDSDSDSDSDDNNNNNGNNNNNNDNNDNNDQKQKNASEQSSTKYSDNLYNPYLGFSNDN